MDGNIPTWLKGQLSASEASLISDQIHQAETRTEGEIVPMIVSSSTPGRSAEWVLMLILLLFTAPLALMDYTQPLFWISEVLLIAGAILLPRPLLGLFPGLRRWLIPHEDLMAAVHMRAILELEDARIRHTQRRTGVLLMVSWAERQVVILGDHAIAEKIKPEQWQLMVTEFAKDLKSGQVARGFEKAITATGQILQLHFPVQGSNPNEIQNDLVIKN